MLQRLSFLLVCSLTLGCSTMLCAQPFDIMDSGGPLLPEQAAYDVTYYDLDIEVKPEERAIAGVLTAEARVVRPIEWFVLDLDTVFTISSVEVLDEYGAARPATYERRGGRLWTDLGRSYEEGEQARVRIQYAGKPRKADNPPWGGGFTWSRTASGDPWIATSLQGEGADLWWPVKDHPSDEPDSMSIHITVPADLVAASNGRLREVTENADGTRTYHWFVSTPINNYNVALNIAPYRTIEGTFRSVTGEEVAATFWVLPEAYEKGKVLFPQMLDHLAYFEKMLGPYPFRADKYGVAHTPYLGMEHQTIIAYGSNFSDKPWGYDWLHFHELAHEWWGNLVTAADWKDFWLHEGLTEYMQALYSEELFGEEAYHKAITGFKANLLNIQPVAPRESQSTDQVYFIGAQEGVSNNDIYYKGAVILHTLRYLIGDEDFFTLLRRFAYPTPELEQVTDGSQTRFVDTEDFTELAKEITGRDLDWFFEVYLRQPALPVLKEERVGDQLRLMWETPNDLPFPMPLEVNVDGRVQRIEMPEGEATIQAGRNVTVDPEGWVLRE